MSRISEGLIAHWPMNDNAASTAVVDSTGNHAGVFTDAGGDPNTDAHDTFAKNSAALIFDGIDDHIVVADHADFSPILTPFSISARCYMDDATGFAIATKDGVAKQEWYFILDVGANSDKISFVVQDASAGPATIGRKYNTVLTSLEGSWAHFAATYDGGTSSNGIKVYVNAVRVDDTDLTLGTFVEVEPFAQPVWIGRDRNEYANGKFDNVMMFGIELTPEEVRRLYNEGHGTEIAALLDDTGPHKRRVRARN